MTWLQGGINGRTAEVCEAFCLEDKLDFEHLFEPKQDMMLVGTIFYIIFTNLNALLNIKDKGC